MDTQTRELTALEKLWNLGFNLRFRFIGMLESRNRGELLRAGDSIYFFGQLIKASAENAAEQTEKLFRIFSETPWLTYRAGFPALYHDIKGTYVSDTGWGCMIRVGQMAFAEMVREHMGVGSQEEMSGIIRLFSDCDRKQPFSIQNISKMARKEFGVLPGDWYNPSQIAHILASLHQAHLQSSLGLTFLVFNSGNLFFDQLTETMLSSAPQPCKCPLPKGHLLCQNCNKSKLSVGVILLTRIGLDSPQQKYLQVLAEMMKLRHFRGMIGGKPGKALYFLGLHNEDSFIYLDPHYVQNAGGSEEELRESYFCGSFRECKASSIDPSIGLCYYIRDVGELNLFYRGVNEVKRMFESDFFIWAAEQTPTYLSKSIRLSKCIELEEEQYQTL